MQGGHTPKIAIFAPQIPDCSCWKCLFNTEFEVEAFRSETDFIKNVRQESTDIAIVCLCSSPESEVDNIIRLEALSGAKPLLTCSKSLNHDFVKNAAVKGVNRFLLCTMDKETIQEIILEAIKHGGLREFLEEHYGENFSISPHIGKMLDEIIYLFPHRLSAHEMAEKLGISRSWQHRLCREAFGRSFSGFIRQIWVYQAMRLMNRTSLDNTDIALHLDYSEGSSMARDFRKELGYSPNEARRLLAKKNAGELMQGN